ncbi:hypothetical protein LWI29_018379 [Acer saccharum]|uniref:Pectinesterase n=1 Tax=Acer saccharum TaxID=4024 RepID=A0AA39SUF0_ACESA|nr:hypothetical protein LWI29_018379 [Acer saccharum]
MGRPGREEAPPGGQADAGCRGAQDGNGDCKTIKEAVDKSKWNVMMYGDGKTATIISGDKNFGVDKIPTFDTATVAVAGRGFIAKDIKFINTAGAEKHQAVAFRSGSDRSVFYQCSFDAFQDTLYAHSNRQFYRDCDITGTIDFIFGNAAVVLQNCNIMPRQPLSNQFNTITAQGKKDPNQNTGISIQNCKFSAFDNLSAPTYLGRPWKDYSTTIIMQSAIGPFLNPLGWKEWVSNVDPPKTIFYAEYQNTGPGSDVSNRVKWAGYKPTLTADEAAKLQIGATSDLQAVKGSFKTYLGRPWKEYSRPVTKQWSITDVIDPVGWHEWDENFALNTLFYSEYQNTGACAGTGTSITVNWKGFKVITSASEAQGFIPARFIAGLYKLPFFLGAGGVVADEQRRRQREASFVGGLVEATAAEELEVWCARQYEVVAACAATTATRSQLRWGLVEATAAEELEGVVVVRVEGVSKCFNTLHMERDKESMGIDKECPGRDKEREGKDEEMEEKDEEREYSNRKITRRGSVERRRGSIPRDGTYINKTST